MHFFSFNHMLRNHNFYDRIIKSFLIMGWVFLPLTNFRWLPNLGTTRPLSSLFFTAAVGIYYFKNFFTNRSADNQPIHHRWIRKFIDTTMEWNILRWWIILLLVGIFSAFLTLFYGNFFQSLNRLLGYFLIFMYLLGGFLSISYLGINRTASWISIGYVPVLLFAFIEIAAILKNPFALQAVLFIRSMIVVDFTWANRMALLATEPSFISFQILLLATIVPFTKSKILLTSNLILILMSILFTLSGSLAIIIFGYLFCVFLYLIPYKARKIIFISLLTGIIVCILIYIFNPNSILSLNAWFYENLPMQSQVKRLFNSINIRYYYILALIYAIWDTHGLGLGIGQFGFFWRDIFRRHIDITTYDVTGEVAHTLATEPYMRPWSVIFGIGADLGLVGMTLLGLFLFEIYKRITSIHLRGIFVASILALVGAYPIVYPHVWLSLALMAGISGSKNGPQE